MVVLRQIQEFLKGAQPLAEALTVATATDDVIEALRRATPNQVTTTVNTANVTAIAAPGSGEHIALVRITVYSLLNDSESILYLKDANTGGTIAKPIPCPTNGSGITDVYPRDGMLHWPTNTPVIADPSIADDHYVELLYLTIDDTTGLPV